MVSEMACDNIGEKISQPLEKVIRTIIAKCVDAVSFTNSEAFRKISESRRLQFNIPGHSKESFTFMLLQLPFVFKHSE